MHGSDAASPRLRNYSLAGAFVAALFALAAVIVVVSGSASSGGSVSGASAHRAQLASARLPLGALAATTPARSAPRPAAPSARANAAAAHVGAASRVAATHAGLVAEQPDPEAKYSAPAPKGVHHAPAATPSSAGAMVAPGAPSDAQVRAELRAMNAAVAAENSSPSASANAIGGDGTVQIPAGVPAVIARVIAGANAITDFPYVYGGGHASFVDSAYDCSGSVSYALAAGGLLGAPETSGQLESWGVPGPGRWISVYASAGHVYMFVDGLRYDTAGRTGVFSTRWQTGPDPVSGPSNAGFVVRHYPGL